jgi:hypothetical protein
MDDWFYTEIDETAESLPKFPSFEEACIYVKVKFPDASKQWRDNLAEALVVTSDGT